MIPYRIKELELICKRVKNEYRIELDTDSIEKQKKEIMNDLGHDNTMRLSFIDIYRSSYLRYRNIIFKNNGGKE
jgi:ACT domain-containing protein